MNVGGLPATTFRYGFAVVMGVMAVIAAAELWYFIRHRWFV
jgi:Mg2+ and Co2+ transporter CorA